MVPVYISWSQTPKTPHWRCQDALALSHWKNQLQKVDVEIIFPLIPCICIWFFFFWQCGSLPVFDSKNIYMLFVSISDWLWKFSYMYRHPIYSYPVAALPLNTLEPINSTLFEAYLLSLFSFLCILSLPVWFRVSEKGEEIESRGVLSPHSHFHLRDTSLSQL